MTRFGIVRFSGAALIALSTAAMIAVGTAGANGGGPGDPVSGDDRAIAYPTPGGDNAVKCEDIGNDGTTWDGDDLEHLGLASDDGVNVTISATPAGVTFTAIVVKGGPAYNLYEPGKRGLAATPPWDGLHSPIGPGESGKPAGLSHWFACGTKGAEETPTCPNGMPGSGDECTPPPCEDTSGEKSGEKDCTPPPCDDKSGDMSGGDKDCTPATPTPTPTASVGGVSGPSPSPSAGGEVEGATPPGKLANTGFNAGLSLGIAGLLLVVGVLMLAAPNHLAVAVGRLRRRG